MSESPKTCQRNQLQCMLCPNVCIRAMRAYPPRERAVGGDAIYRKVNIVIETA